MEAKITKIKSALLDRMSVLVKKAEVADLFYLTNTLNDLSGKKTDPMETMLKILEKTKKEKDKK